MQKTSQALYYIIPAGATREEACTRSDIEAMVKAGQVLPDSLVFVPGEKKWKRAADTELGDLFEKPDSEGARGEAETEKKHDLEEELQRISKSLESSPDSLDLNTRAARLSLELGDRKAARFYYQKALEISPFNPRIAREIKRDLPREDIKGLAFLKRKPPFWQEIKSAFTYPFGRGWRYPLALTLCFSTLRFLPWGSLVASLLGFLFILQVIRACGGGNESPPLWPLEWLTPGPLVVKQMLVGIVVAAELSGPFLVASQISVSLGAGGGVDNAFSLLGRSPVMVVILATLTFAYLPAVLMMSACSPARFSRAVNPAKVFSMIRYLEAEYLLSAAFIFFLFLGWNLIGSILGFIPYLGLVLSTGVGLCYALAGAWVLGRLCSRYEHVLIPHPPGDSTRS